MPRSLRYQLLSRSLMILIGLLLLIGIFQYVFMEQFLYKNKAASIQSLVRSIPYPSWQQMIVDPSGILFKNPISSLRMPDTTVAFVDMTGHFYDLIDEPEQSEAPQLSAADYRGAFNQQKDTVDYKIIEDKTGTEQLVVLQPVGIHDTPLGIVQVSTKVRPLLDVLVRQLMIFLFLAICALVVGLLTFLPILRRTLIPLSRMVETVERINSGNLDERLPAQQAQMEIGRLSSAFNDMLKRLELSFDAEKEAKEKMRRFIADAAHELRTPLTSIHGFVEVLLRGAATNPDQLNKALQSMYGESERLNKLVQDLILLARLDREPTVHLTEGELDKVVHDMEPQLRLLAGERKVCFSITEDVQTKFDPDRMRQVILNLFQNAVQHTDPEEGKIQVSLTKGDDEIMLAIQDNGTGISKEHLSHLFERFYRIDSARSRRNGGAGLGLAITKSIVETHGGTIECESELGEGTLFRVRLPKL